MSAPAAEVIALIFFVAEMVIHSGEMPPYQFQ